MLLLFCSENIKSGISTTHLNSKQLINQSLNISHVSLIKGGQGKKKKTLPVYIV